MKKQIKINTSFSAAMSEFKSGEDGLFSRAKLKVFYDGVTADHRRFSTQMQENLKASLPYTPVVSYYDSDKQDFVGHATKQAIYGIVDPCGTITEEVIDDKKWLVADVVLYTERPDVGAIAQQIVGKSQSLELDPSTVKYNITLDKKHNVKEIEFTDGKFLGVSVLGDDQEPAFSGSSFFTVDTAFEEKMQILRDFCKKEAQPSITAEVEVEEDSFDYAKFVNMSWGERGELLSAAVWDLYHYSAYLAEIFDDYIVARTTDGLMKHLYTIDDSGKVTISQGVRVYAQYVEYAPEIDTEPQPEPETADYNAIVEPVAEESVMEEAPVEETSVIETAPAEESASVGEDAHPAEPVEDATPATDDFNSEPVAEESELNNEETESTSLTASEKTELSALKREKNQTIYEKYQKFLDEDEKEKFNSMLDTCDAVDFENQLMALCYDRREQERNNVRVIYNAPEVNDGAPLTLEERMAAVMRKYK